jgi:His/Glu/Gln/Arg/opine family amino acid ABC transporter permease subunit
MLESFNFRVILEYMPLFLQGLGGTVYLSGISLVGAMLLGVIVCVARLSGLKAFSIPAVVFTELIRSTPLLTQLFFFYFGLPSLGIRMTESQTGILALSLNSGAYIAEILRAGMMSITRGQIEAATASGLSLFQRLRHIILPQAIGITTPALLGQMIVLVKDSALLALISVLELTRAGQLLASDRFMPAEGFFTAALFYLVLYYILKWASHAVQKKLIFRQA